MNSVLPDKRVKNRYKCCTVPNLSCLISVSQPTYKAKRACHHGHARYQAKYSDRYHFSFTAFIAAKVGLSTKFERQIALASRNCKYLYGTAAYHLQRPRLSDKTVLPVCDDESVQMSYFRLVAWMRSACHSNQHLAIAYWPVQRLY